VEKIGKFRRTLQTITLAIIILIGAVIVNIDNIVIAANAYGVPDYSDTAEGDGVFYELDEKGNMTGEIFKQYKQYTQSSEVPRNLFANDNITLWCIQHGTPIFKYMTATEEHYHAFQKKEMTNTKYDPLNPFWLYGRESGSVTTGLWPNHKNSVHGAFEGTLGDCCTEHSVDNYYGDDQDAIDWNNQNMPGVKEKLPAIYSIVYHRTHEYTAKQYQNAFFVLTQKHIYENADDMPQVDYVTDEEMKSGYFTIAQKQAALWEIGEPLNIGNSNNKNDRMLGSAAKAYQDFYEKLHAGIDLGDDVTVADKNNVKDRKDNYADYVTAYNADEEGNIKEKDGKESQEDIESVVVDNGQIERPNGGNLDPVTLPNEQGQNEAYTTFKYKDTQVEVDTKEQCFVLGPYVIDYTINDEDNYGSLDTYEVKDRGGSSNKYQIADPEEWKEEGDESLGEYGEYDEYAGENEDYNVEEDGDVDAYLRFTAVEKITVYNQNKRNIEELGGRFKIAYKYPQTPKGNETSLELITEKDGVMHKRINEKNLDTGDSYYYELADGEETKAFKSRKPFYIVVYKGSMRSEDFAGFYAKIDFQYLESIDGEIYGYEGNVIKYWYERTEVKWTPPYNGTSISGHDDPINGHYDESASATNKKEMSTWKYELKREQTSSKSQQFIGYHHSSRRIYKRYTVVLTSDWDVREPEIEIEKVDKNNKNKKLAGARFSIKATVTGEDIHKNQVDRIVYFNGIKTDRKGIAKITTADFEQKGIFLGNFTGKVYLEFKEQYAPAGYKKLDQIETLEIRLEKGRIISGATSANGEYNDEKVTIVIDNEKSGTPKIQLAKVNGTNGLIEEAYFNIHVAYTDPETGRLINTKSNIITGQTEKGTLNLTREDFLNMRYGLDIENYTGKLTLNITEISAGSGYSISSSGMTITLTYKDGTLTKYTHNTNQEVLVHYLYDNVIENIYNWTKGNTSKIEPWAEEVVKKWVNEQLINYRVFADEAIAEGWTPEKVTYDDVLEWLAEYIRKNGLSLEEWRKSVFTSEIIPNSNGDIVQITVENFPGIDIPDMNFQKTPPTQGILMTIGGNVFLDQSENKNSANDGDGYFTEGEMLIEGIEVTLIDKETGKPAELVSAEKEYGKDDERSKEIRTNPTLTNEKGYYEFRGVDPLREYVVKFTYNGIEYSTTASNQETYNSDKWAVSSKGSELQADRNKLNNDFSIITANTKAYDNDVLEGIQREISQRIWQYIYEIGYDKDGKSYYVHPHYPDLEMIYNAVKDNHKDDAEIGLKIDYIKRTKINAYAGYFSMLGGTSSIDDVGTYPYYTINNSNGMSMKNNDSINAYKASGEDEIKFAKNQVKLLYPGQLQIHLGLRERDSINLSLTTDIVETTVSINRYDTTYDYYKGLSSYKQYLFEEDYNYSVKDGNGQHKKYDVGTTSGDGTAYYTEDEIDFYMTYEAKVNNETTNEGNLIELVDYYDRNFTHAAEEGQNSYTTSKGNVIPAYQVFLNGQDITNRVTVSTNSKYGTAKEYGNSLASKEYKGLFVSFNDPKSSLMILDGELRIRLTFKMNKGKAEAVSKNLYDHLYQANNGGKYSKSWQIYNYAEINAYATKDGYLDYNSRPGNLDVQEYINKRKDYQTAYNNYLLNPTADNERAIKLALARLNTVREDDAWTVSLTLTNNGSVRELSGNVWEAVSDDVKNSLGLNKAYGERYLKYSDLTDEQKAKLNLEGIKVELVELLQGNDTENGANQIVRAVTKTASDGSYKFDRFIAGNYTVRFVYGDYANTDNYDANNNTNGVIRSKITKYADGREMPVNGQYYQATRSNPNTDIDKYWYKDMEYNEGELKRKPSGDEFLTRYSDAYDDAYSRLTQMGSEVVTEKENFYNNSIEYDYQGVREVETVRHTDPIYAYTSTMELEIEYTRPKTTGNAKQSWYEYKVNNVDFGITPRATADVNIDKYVSNMKIYLPDGNKLIDVTFNQDGSFTETEGVLQIGKEHIGAKYTDGGTAINLGAPSNSYPDGHAYINYNEQLLQRARIEVTYTIVVSNDSIYDDNGTETKDDDVYDRIKYITIGTGENAKRIAVIYYEENTNELTAYEGGAIVYHNSSAEEYNEKELVTVDSSNRVANTNSRLKGYSRITGFNDTQEAEIIKSRATQIIDYPNAPFDFVRTVYEDDTPSVNKYWVDIENKDFVTSREQYESTKTGNPLLDSYSHKLVATSKTDKTEESPLYKVLKPGETTQDNLVLTLVLASTNIGDVAISTNPDDDLTGADYELSNLVEITRMANQAGKVTELEGYELDGKESSSVRQPEKVDNGEGKPEFVPTIATAKSETIIIATPTGLTFNESMFGANLWIALVALIVLAGGLVIIKKFVLVRK